MVIASHLELPSKMITQEIGANTKLKKDLCLVFTLTRVFPPLLKMKSIQ